MSQEYSPIERTEAPTPRRIAQAVQEGNWPLSRHLAVTCSMLAVAIVLGVVAGQIQSGLTTLMSQSLGTPGISLRQGSLLLRFQGAAATIVAPVVLLLAVSVAVTVVASMAQTGLRIHPERVVPSLDRIASLNGLQRLVTPQGTLRSALSLMLWGLLFALGCWCIACHGREFGFAVGWPLQEAARHWWKTALRVLVQLLLLALAAGILDYAWRWWDWYRALRMSREEQREERRESEVSPLVQTARRRKQQEQADRRASGAIAATDVLLVGSGGLVLVLRCDVAGEFVLIRRAIGPAGQRLLRGLPRTRRLLHQSSLALELYRNAKLGERVAREHAARLATLRTGTGL